MVRLRCADEVSGRVVGEGMSHVEGWCVLGVGWGSCLGGLGLRRAW